MHKQDYTYRESLFWLHSYRVEGTGVHGTPEGMAHYTEGMELARQGAKYDQDNYEYYFYFQEHDEECEREGKRLFEEAAQCFKLAAEQGNELAMMNYALYLFAFKDEEEEGLKWFEKASELGLDVADYELALFHARGLCGLPVDAEKSAFYMERFREGVGKNERQFFLAWDVSEDSGLLGRAHMFAWFCGASECEIYDTPKAKPSSWKYIN